LTREMVTFGDIFLFSSAPSGRGLLLGCVGAIGVGCGVWVKKVMH